MPASPRTPNLSRPTCRLAASYSSLRRHERPAFFAALAGLAAFGVWLLLYSTPQGLGLNDDGIAYVAGARGILSGQGYREIWIVSAGPVTHFPPGFPAALALAGLLTGLDPLRAARLVNGALFGLNILLAGWLAWRMTRSRGFGLLGALLFLLTPSLLRIHSNAMSEPLYVFLTLTAFLFLDLYFQAQEKGNEGQGVGWLIAAGCVVGLAYLTRYAALALLATAVVALVVLHGDWRMRWTRSAIVIGSALPWMIAWSIRNELTGGALTNRKLDWHPITPDNIQTGLRTFATFLAPIGSWQTVLWNAGWLFQAFLVLLALGLLVWVVRAGLNYFLRPLEARRPEPVSLLNGLYAFGYFLALFFTMTFFDPATRFQLRILAPVFVSLLFLLMAGLYWLYQRGAGRWMAPGLAVLVFAVSGFGQVQTVQELHRGGQVYANARWFDAPIFDALRALPADVAIHTDQPGVVYLYVGRAASLLPEDGPGISKLQREVQEGRAVIALFRSPGMDDGTRAYYHELGEGLYQQQYDRDVIYSAQP